MGFFGDLFGGTASAGLGLLGQYLNVGYQKELQEHAGAVNYKYAEKTARNQPTWQRAGLESAGYNPLLAVQNATSGANAGWTSTGQANSVDLSTSVANAIEVQRLSNETKQTESTTNLQNQQAQTEENKRQNLDFDSMMKDAKRHLTDKETSWYDKKANAEIYRNMQEAEQARAVASVQAYNAETARIASNAQKLQSETSATWTPAKIASGFAIGALGSFGLGRLGQVAKGAKWFKYGGKHVNDWKTIYNGL